LNGYHLKHLAFRVIEVQLPVFSLFEMWTDKAKFMLADELNERTERERDLRSQCSILKRALSLMPNKLSNVESQIIFPATDISDHKPPLKVEPASSVADRIPFKGVATHAELDARMM
jgi:hypothetical protein